MFNDGAREVTSFLNPEWDCRARRIFIYKPTLYRMTKYKSQFLYKATMEWIYWESQK